MTEGGPFHGRGHVRIDEINDMTALERIKPAWKDLLDRCDDESPYLTPEFMLPWIRRVKDRYAFRMLAAREGDRLVGIAPLFERRIRKFGVTFSVRSFAESAASPPQDIVVSERHDEVMEAFVGHWMRSGRWDLIDLLNVPSESRTGSLLRRAVEGTGVRLTCRESLRTYYVPVATNWETFRSALSRNLRHNLRRGLDRCRASGEVRFARYPGDGVGLEEAKRMALEVVGKSWKTHDDGPAGWNNFLRELMGELGEGGLLGLRFLLVGGEPIAYLLEVDYRRNVYAVHGAYDLSRRSANPGQLILEDALRDAHERGCGKYDFCGTKDYLGRWTGSTRAFDRIRLVNRSALSRLKAHLYVREHDRRNAAVLRETEAAKNTMVETSRGKSKGAPGPGRTAAGPAADASPGRDCPT